MDATPRKTTTPPAKLRPLPTIREWAEARPAVDPVLAQRMGWTK